MSAFSTYLNELKNTYSFKIIDVARRCHLDTNTVYSWFSGRSTPASPSAIDTIARSLTLSKVERFHLEKSYMETTLGKKKYQNYLMIHDSISYIYRECKEPIDLTSPMIHTELSPPGEPYFKELHTHNSINLYFKKLLLDTEKDDTIHLVLNHNTVSLLSYVKDGLLLTGSRKFKILLCVPMRDLFYNSRSSTILRTLFELFFYCDDIDIMIMNHDKVASTITENYVFTSQHFIMFEDDMQSGAATTYPEWISDYHKQWKHWIKYADKIGQKSLSAEDYVLDFIQPTSLKVYEFMPCFTIKLDHELLEQHFYPNLPGRDLLINEIETRILLDENSHMVLYNYSSEKGLRYFMETGKIATYPFPIYEPFNLEERILILERLIDAIRCGYYRQQFYKNQIIEHLPMFQVEIHEAEPRCHAEFYIIQDNLQVHKIYFYNPQILDSIRDFFEVLSTPRYSMSEEESLALLERIRDEYHLRFLN